MIRAKVLYIDVCEGLSYVRFDADGLVLSMLSLENLGLSLGQNVHLGFKSSDVFLATNQLKNCSVTNEIPSKISAIKHGQIVTCVYLQTPNFAFESVISTRSAHSLSLKLEDSVFAYVKATSIFISSYDD